MLEYRASLWNRYFTFAVSCRPYASLRAKKFSHWKLTWEDGWDWAPFDCKHTSYTKLETKRSATKHPWHQEGTLRKTNLRASTLLPLKATMRRTEAHGSIPAASTRTFTSLLDTSTGTDILTTATPGSGVSLSWRKGIFRQSEEHRIVETQANRRSVRHG